MIFKKALGKIYGVEYSKEEQKAMEIEINRQFTEHERAHQDEIDAMVLYVLHKKFGFGHKRLWEMYKSFNPVLDELLTKYEQGCDRPRACTEALKEYGIDIQEWREKLAREAQEG